MIHGGEQQVHKYQIAENDSKNDNFGCLFIRLSHRLYLFSYFLMCRAKLEKYFNITKY